MSRKSGYRFSDKDMRQTNNAEAAAWGSAAGHRREERDLARAGDRSIGLDVGAIDRRTDHLRVVKRMGVFFATPGQPGHQLADGLDAGRRLDRLVRLADPLAHPGEVQDLHAYHSIRCYSIRCRTPARK